MRVQLKTTVREGHFKRTLKRSMREHRALTLVYRRQNGSLTTRTVEPFALTRNAAGDVYFRAMDRQSGESRTWRVDRIEGYGLADDFRLEVPEGKSDASRLTQARMAEWMADEDMRREHAANARRAFEAALLAAGEREEVRS